MSEEAELSSLTIPPSLSDKLRPHQIDALHFIWSKLVDDGLMTVLRASPSASLAERAGLHSALFGCIIGHSMGLGKTVTALAFLSLLQDYASTLPAASGAAPALRVLVLAPRSCTMQWQSSAAEWAPRLQVLAPQGTAAALEPMLREHHERGGVLVLGYEEYQRLLQRARAQASASAASALCARVPSVLDGARPPLPRGAVVSLLDAAEAADVIVLDEAHRLKRVASRLVSDVTAHSGGVPLRLALTGTPLQNHLEEYNVMHAVVTGRAPDPAQFRRLFVAPIERGQCADSTFKQFRQMQRCVESLRRFFGAAVHHCGPDVLERELPPRRECVIFVRLSPQQEEAYRAMLERRIRERFGGDTAALVFELHHEASHICCHPALTLSRARALVSLHGGARRSVTTRPLYLDQVETNTFLENSCGSSSGVGGGGGYKKAKAKAKNNKKHSYGEDDDDDDDDDGDDDDDDDDDGLYEELKDGEEEGAQGGDMGIGNNDRVPEVGSGYNGDRFSTEADTMFEQLNVRESPKLAIVLALLRRIANDLHEKVAVFSTYRSHLFLLQRLLQSHAGITVDILHGALSVQERQNVMDRFASDTARPVLLCSTRAGGVGVNLVAANHCVLMDVSWNPADDTQATYRVYRYGQHRPVSVYRIATEGTFEHVVFFYALSKTWVHRKIADVADPTRHERHVRENYFTYPCALPIGAAPATGAEEWVTYASQHCPALALTAPDGVFGDVRSIVEHSFLLRDDTDEAIHAMSSRFESEQRVLEERSRPRAPIPLCIDEGLPAAASPPGAGLPLSACEPALRRCLADAAAALLARDSSPPSLRALLCDAAGAPASAPGALVALAAFFYAQGLEQLMRDTLSRPAYAQLRAQLQGRAGPGQSIEEALRTRPVELLASLGTAEGTYLLTELGLVRPLVAHCTIWGARLVLLRSAAPAGTLRKLYRLLQGNNDSNNNNTNCSDQEKTQTREDADAADACSDNDRNSDSDDDDDDDGGGAERVAECVSAVLESLWPPLEGIARVVAIKDLPAKRRLTARAYAAAHDASSAFLTAREAAALIGLSAVPGRRDQFFCRRCSDALLSRAPPNGALRCAHCHYSAEFDAQTHAATRHAAALFQMSTACGLVGRFAVSRSLSAAFAPALCRDAAHALRQLCASSSASSVSSTATAIATATPTATNRAAAAEFVRAACAAGISSVVDGLPRTTALRVALQCGAPPVEPLAGEWLREVFAADSSGVWRTRLRPHTRRAADEWLRERSGVAALPEAFVALALRGAAERSHATFARTLLDPSGNLNNSSSSGNHNRDESNGGGAPLFDGSGDDALLRFVCDALVTLRYIERLLSAPPDEAPLLHDDVSSLSGGSRSPSNASDGSIASVARRARPTKRRRSPVGSAASSWSSGASSFSSCYSDDGMNGDNAAHIGDRDSVENIYNEENEENENGGTDSAARKGSAAGAKKEPAAGKHIAPDEVLRTRLGRYWAAYCDVYGTRGVETLTVMVEDEEQGMVILPPPPNSFWVSEVKDSTRDGMRITAAVEEFMERIIALAASVRVIK